LVLACPPEGQLLPVGSLPTKLEDLQTFLLVSLRDAVCFFYLFSSLLIRMGIEVQLTCFFICGSISS